MAGGVRAGCRRVDRGPIESAPAVASALPMVLRHDAGNVEASPVHHRTRTGRAPRPPWPAVPSNLPDLVAAMRARSRSVRAVWRAVPASGAGRRGLVWTPRGASLDGGVRPAPRWRAPSAAYQPAASAVRLPTAALPGRHPVNDHGAVRWAAALAPDEPDGCG